MKKTVNLLNEIGMLAQIPRSGFAFLGSGKQSVAEHSFRVALIAHVLCRLSSEKVDHDKLIMICLLHDLPESRIGDLNYVQKRYVQADLPKAINEIKKGSQFGPEIAEWIEEYENSETIESKLAHDADQIELMLMLKKEQELGNTRALDWFKNAQKRLKTDIAKQLSETILTIPSDAWWFENMTETNLPKSVSETMNEWQSKEDDEAYKNL